MNETLMEKEATSKTQSNMEAYFKTHDVQYVAKDAVFINLATGEETKGREAIGEMLHYIYHVAFDAKAEIKNQLITDTKALMEANFKGRHIGEFAGIAATHREVNVPICISYDLEEGLVKTARIYMLVNVMMQQLQG